MGVLLGAFIAAFAGLVGLGISKRTEHEQWTRNQKLETYAGILKVADEAYLSIDSAPEVRIAMALRLQDAMTRVALIAPKGIWEFVSAAQRAILDYQSPEGHTNRQVADTASDALAALKEALYADLHNEGSIVEGHWLRFAARNLSKK